LQAALERCRKRGAEPETRAALEEALARAAQERERGEHVPGR